MSGGGKAVDEDNDMTARGMTECGVKKILLNMRYYRIPSCHPDL